MNYENKSNKVIKKRLDRDGKIYIPKEIRKELKISSNDFLSLRIENQKIILEKSDTNRCFNCDAEARLIKFKNSLVCEKCFNELAIK